MELNLTEYTLPVYWASYLFNGDASGLQDNEQAEIDAFIKREGLSWPLALSEDSWFAHSNDAGTLACDVATYTFESPKENS